MTGIYWLRQWEIAGRERESCMRFARDPMNPAANPRYWVRAAREWNRQRVQAARILGAYGDMEDNDPGEWFPLCK